MSAKSSENIAPLAAALLGLMGVASPDAALAQARVAPTEVLGIAVPGPQAIRETDKASGAKADPQLVADFGGAYAGSQAALVQRVGRTVAVESGIADALASFSFKLLNSPVENAFAIPGGYVYVTRALLALMNNEAELAFVLGHETGHVAAHHSDARAKVTQRNVLLGALGQAVLGGLLGNGTLGQVGQKLGQTGIQRLVVGNVMSHSRKDEFEADDLGTVYMARAGYGTGAAATVLASLAAQTDLERREGGSTRTTPGWALSHPEPATRVARLLQRARDAGAAAPATRRNSAAFLQALDGMLAEDDPRQGVIEGQTFLFPDDRFKFSAPAGYGMSNGADVVTISASGGGNGQATFTGGTYDGNLNAVLARAIAAISEGKGAAPASPTTGTINGMQVLSASASAQDSSGNALDVTFYAIARSPTKAYSFTLIQPNGRGPGDLAPLVQSFAAMSATEAAAVRPRVIRVVTVKAGDTVSAMAAKMAYPKQARERFLVLNGLATGTDRLAPGSKVKLVVYGAQGR